MQTNLLLSTTALALALLFAPQTAHAQAAQRPAAAPAGQQSVSTPDGQSMKNMERAEQSLHRAVQQMSTATPAHQQHAVSGLRRALLQMQQAVATMPEEHDNAPAHRALQQQITKAIQTLEVTQVDPTRVQAEVDQVFAAFHATHGEMGTSAHGAKP